MRFEMLEVYALQEPLQEKMDRWELVESIEEFGSTP